MDATASYSQQLRPLGQQLEALGIDSFTLRLEGDTYVVNGQKRSRPQQKSERSLWQRLRSASNPSSAPPPSAAQELRFSLAELTRLDDEGLEQRSTGGGSADAHSLSQILRAVGAFVEQKQGRLIGVTKDGQDIAIEYESAPQRHIIDKFTVFSLYDFWVKMYLRRSERTEPFPKR